MVEIYRKNGYDSIVLTNHFTVQLPGESTEEKIKWYLQDYYKCCEEGALVGLNVILGAELRFTENNNDYLIFGISPEDFKNIYKLLPYYGQECLCGILTSKPLENSYDVSDVLKSRDYRMTIGGYLVSI